MRRPRLLVFSLFAALAFAAPASAQSTSAIISPGNGSELFYDGDNGSGSVTVQGTVSGSDWGTRGDLLCLYNNNTAFDPPPPRSPLLTTQPITNGSFAFDVSLGAVAGDVCRLAFVPHGFRPTGAEAAAYTGPAISVSKRFSLSFTGNQYGYDILSGTLPWSFDFNSLGSCPVAASYATDLGSLGSFQLFDGNTCLPQQSGIPPFQGTRSAIQIDGLNAYAPGAISNLTADAGFEPLSYSASFDAAHDAVTIQETDPLMICNPQTGFPPNSSSSCARLVPAGVKVQQTTTLRARGQVTRMREAFSSTDGRPHSLDLLFAQTILSADGTAPGFEFPGQPSFATHQEPDSFSTFPGGASSIIVIGDPALLPSVSNPIGSITYSRPPSSAEFITPNGARAATFLMHYAQTVRRRGALAYNWSLAQASSSTGLAGLEGVERDRFVAPSLTLAYPRNRVHVDHPYEAVRGRASDPVGIASLTLDGRTITLHANGTFATYVKLHVGSNVVRVRAVNAGGNVTERTATVFYARPPCIVPRLRGQTLTAAERALRTANCNLGTVTRARSKQVHKGLVISSDPTAGHRLSTGAKVELVVSRGK